ncbi:hypothetical protein L9F63_023999, partial [Diploptera punctata]
FSNAIKGCLYNMYAAVYNFHCRLIEAARSRIVDLMHQRSLFISANHSALNYRSPSTRKNDSMSDNFGLQCSCYTTVAESGDVMIILTTFSIYIFIRYVFSARSVTS